MSRPNTPTCTTLNWPAYCEALKRRGSLTIWFDPAMALAAQPTGRRGRQSSVEELEQEFNSPHTLRAAREANIASLRSEGWVPVRDQYDDGGISGWTLERPGLKQLLADIVCRKRCCQTDSNQSLFA